MISSNFYNSSEWRGLLEYLKMSRVNEQGDLICEYCGRPITKKYDCIGHHKLELRDHPELALDPDNIALVHHGCHNKLHLRNAGKVRERQAVYLVYGSPCAGKQSWVASVAGDADVILSMDSLWDAVSVGGADCKDDHLKAVVFALRDTLLDCARTRRGKWQHYYIIGGYPYLMERNRLCASLGAEPVYVECEKQECLEIAKQRPGDWVKYVEDWWDKFQPDIPPGVLTPGA